MLFNALLSLKLILSWSVIMTMDNDEKYARTTGNVNLESEFVVHLRTTARGKHDDFSG